MAQGFTSALSQLLRQEYAHHLILGYSSWDCALFCFKIIRLHFWQHKLYCKESLLYKASLYFMLFCWNILSRINIRLNISNFIWIWIRFAEAPPGNVMPVMVLPVRLKCVSCRVPLLLLKDFYDNSGNYNPFNCCEYETIIPYLVSALLYSFASSYNMGQIP